MRTFYIESSVNDPWYNLALEQTLSETIEEGDVLFYLWQNERTVVIGRNQNAARECRGELLESEGGYLARRKTGGGAVYHDLGNLCFTFAASPELYDLERQMRVVMAACRHFGLEVVPSGRNDIITKDGFKFSGNAFSVNSRCKLQHGTIMVDVDRSMLERYLTPSKLKMSSKGISSVRSRVCNLKQLCPDITISELKKVLLAAFAKEYAKPKILTPEDMDQEKLKEYYDLYSSWDWRYGKSPAGTVDFEHLFPWGEVSISLTVEGMHITGCKAYSDCLDVELPGLLEVCLTGLRYEAASLEAAASAASDERVAGVCLAVAAEMI